MEQHAKETACRLAAQRGLSLYTRGHGVYGVDAVGREHLVCRGHDPTTRWSQALRALSSDEMALRRQTARFVLHAPGGTFRANSWVTLVVRWITGRRDGR